MAIPGATEGVTVVTGTLNLGAGQRIIEGAVNHDRIKHRPEIDMAFDLDDIPWPVADGSFDAIDARSVFEHLRPTLIEVCDECWRILRPGGRLVLVYPIVGQITSYEDPTHRWHWTLHSIDYLDPDTQHGRDYAYYTARKWQILAAGEVHGRNVKAILTPRK